MDKATAYNEDWAKRTWDVRDAAGVPIDDLAALAQVYGTTEPEAARLLLGSPAYPAAPQALRDQIAELDDSEEWVEGGGATTRTEESPMTEEKGKPNPFAKNPKGGGDKPPEITTGSFVSWSGGKGRVDLVVSKGKVPGVDDEVEGTEKSPAARVTVWKDGKPTREKIAKSTHVLKRIAPLNFGKKDAAPSDAIVERLALHEEVVEEMGLPAYSAVTGRAIKSVFDRGIDSYPGEEVTDLTAPEWALGRVDHFLKVARGEIETKDAAGHDTDLLVDEHPLSDIDPDGLTATGPDGEPVVNLPGDPEQPATFTGGADPQEPGDEPGEDEGDGEGGDEGDDEPVTLSKDVVDQMLADIEAEANGGATAEDAD